MARCGWGNCKCNRLVYLAVSEKEKAMKVVYVAGRYRGKGEWRIWQNIQHASEEARKLWLKGYAVICPHRNTMFFGTGRTKDADIWITGDLEILARCDAIYMLKGWKQSVGARMEYRLAKDLGKEIMFEDGKDGVRQG